MKRFVAVAGALMLGLVARAAEGNPISRAVLQGKSGAAVASLQADPSGRVRFTSVPPGEYRLVLTSADGRSVSVADLDGDGRNDIIIEGAQSSPGGGAGAGKVNVQDLSMTKRQGQGSPTAGNALGGALPGGAVISAGVVSPRDHASGLPTGKRMHKPYACLVDWDGSVKGGFQSESAARAEGQRLPENANGRCAIKVLVDEQPGTIEVLSWSWGVSKAKPKNKTGHITLMK